MSGALAALARLASGTGVTVLVGMLSFVLAYAVLERALPFSLTRELGQKRNPAVGVLMLSLAIGLALIAAATARPPAP
ncbi:MAG: DUF350 domain-containing protein [Polyangiaceae bacterium]|nr:DUF350 domain-containing protein [Polyangiaceae bacterium]